MRIFSLNHRFLFYFFFLFLLAFSMPQGFSMETSYDRNFVVPEMQSGFKTELYEAKAIGKLERGLQNFFLGWLEIPHGVKGEYYYRKQEYLPGGIEPFFIGAFKGFFNAAGRTAVGIYETFTFPFPQEPILQEFDEWLY